MKPYQSSLLRVQAQAIFTESLRQYSQHPASVSFRLEDEHSIIGIAYQKALRSLSRRLVARRCCPRLSQLRGPLTINRLSGLNHTAFALAVYASQLSFSRGNCTATQNSLPAGGQPLPGGIGYPQNYSVKFQSLYLHDFPLTQASPGATRPAVYESRQTQSRGNLQDSD